MNDLKSLSIGILLFMLGQVFTFYQLNGQFIWKWIEKNPLLISLLGIPISLVFIYATKYTVIAFDYVMWPQRFIGFASGIFIYAWGTYYYFNQPIDVKTALSLCLAVVLIGIQVLWK